MTTTTAKGKFTACGDYFSLTYTCSGPSCVDLNGFANTTCTTAPSGELAELSCDNGVTCPGPSNYTSDFTYTQEHVVVAVTQNINLGVCGSFIVTSDGTTGGTKSEVIDPGNDPCASNKASNTTASMSTNTTVSSVVSSSLPGSSPSSGSSPAPYQNATIIVSSSLTPSSPIQFTGAAPPRRPSRAAIALLLLISVMLFVQGSAAYGQPNDDLPIRRDTVPPALSADDLNTTSQHLIHRRASSTALTADPKKLAETWVDIAKALAEYVGNKLNTATDPNKALFEENFVAEIANAICTHYAGNAVNKILGADLVEACTTAILTGSALEPPLEFLAIIAAGTACNLGVAYLFDHTPVLSDISSLVEEFCSMPKPCGDLLTDPNNCGACGNKCPTGICKNGACTSNSCTGQTCDTFTPCGPGGTCVCASTTEGTGFCVDGTTPCDGLVQCQLSTQCGSGEICAVQSCCGVNVCVGATICGGNGGSGGVSPRDLFLGRGWAGEIGVTVGRVGGWGN